MGGFTVRLYRYNPAQDDVPYNQVVEVGNEYRHCMVLDLLEHLKTRDTTLAFRRSCREGVCGSDGLSINGRNGLGCITNVADALGNKEVLEIRPLPGMPVIRDLVVEPGEVHRAIGIAAGVPVFGGFAGYRDKRAPGQTRRPLQRVSLPGHWQLHGLLPQRPQPLEGHWAHQSHAGS